MNGVRHQDWLNIFLQTAVLETQIEGKDCYNFKAQL